MKLSGCYVALSQGRSKCDDADAGVTPFHADLNGFVFARSVFGLAYLSAHLADIACWQAQ
jgi:hypothetical protein